LSAARIGIVLLAGAMASFAQQTASAWSAAKAAGYLDKRITWWMSWPVAARDHGTFCVSCHTATPFVLGRTALHGALGESSVSANEQKVFDNVTKRVRAWHDVEPFYPDQTRGVPKTAESRGTESILNALILISRDAARGHLSADARVALENMWGLQMDGAWAWLQFHNAPFEGDSQFYGNCLAAIAIGSAPEGYQQETGIQNGVRLLQGWLTRNMEAQTPLDRVVLLWASTKLKGLLTNQEQSRIVGETLERQREDGGFSMASMIPGWKRHDNTPIDPASDGYATGLVAYALEEMHWTVGVPGDALARALGWLEKNQLEDGRWPAVSLNNNRAVMSDTGLFMSDAATAYAVLALTHAGPH
jgi:hypothetical protein